jgi:hypothetical protein
MPLKKEKPPTSELIKLKNVKKITLFRRVLCAIITNAKLDVTKRLNHVQEIFTFYLPNSAPKCFLPH